MRCHSEGCRPCGLAALGREEAASVVVGGSTNGGCEGVGCSSWFIAPRFRLGPVHTSVVGSGMQLSREQFELIEHLLPKQRGDVTIDNLTVLNAVLYVAVNGCAWRCLPTKYGRWHTV